MKRIGADYLVSISDVPLKNGVVTLSDEGEVLKIETISDRGKHDDINWYKGVVMPGLINAHCHLELSHLEGKIDSGTGLLHFIGQVVQMRNFEQDVIQSAIKRYDQLMYDNGIVAVGDISNSTDTVNVKTNSPIHYHSFIEMFDMMQPELTESTFNQYNEVFNAFHTEKKNAKSAVPHAPYSVSDELFEQINGLNKAITTVSIHNQELWDEDELFKNKKGGFLDFYSNIGMSLDSFVATGKSALQSTLPKMDNRHRTLLVHNTMTKEDDVIFAHNWGEIYWASCPNANLYIENRLPDYKMLLANKATICLGTDSMSSNWQLSIIEEMKAVYKYNAYISLDEIFQWATINGAKALGIANEMGTIEVGKRPGLVHLEMNWYDPSSFLRMDSYSRI